MVSSNSLPHKEYNDKIYLFYVIFIYIYMKKKKKILIYLMFLISYIEFFNVV